MKEKIMLLLVLISIIALPLVMAEGENTTPEQPPAEPPMPPQGEGPQEPMSPPPEAIPEGCHSIETGSGMYQMECDFEFNEPEFQEFDLKKEIEQCDGKFEMINGTPICIKEGKTGFAGTVCPTNEELNSIKSKCNEKIEEFIDGKGCNAVMCINQEFKEHYDEVIEEKYGDDPVKAQAIQCEKDSGHFMFIKDEPKCIQEFNEPIAIKENAREISPQEMTEIADRLDAFQDKIAEAGKKLERVKQGYIELGETDAVQAVEYGIQKLSSVQIKISEIKSKLSSGNLTQEQMNQIRIDIQTLRKEISQAVKSVATGKVPTIEEIEAAVKEQFDKFHGSPFGSEEEFQKFLEQEKGAMEIVRGCDKYDSSNVKSFVPPDPEGFVVKVELYFNGINCMMTLHTKEGKKAEFTVTEKEYKNFNDPTAFVEMPCTGDCTALNEIFSMAHGPGGPEEKCMEECIKKDCTKSMFECMHDNLESCELECGLRKEGEGPFGPGGEIDPFQGCIMTCIGEDKMCQPGGTDPVCNACEEKCMAEYGPGIGYEHCLNEEQLMEKEEQCIANGGYGEPVESSTPEGKMCISDVICKNYDPSEWGDNPGTGPPTGQAILNYPAEMIDGFFEWLKELFE